MTSKRKLQLLFGSTKKPSLINGLVGGWSFEDGWTDVLGVKTLTPNGSPEFATGKIARGAKFVATSQQNAVAGNTDYQFGDTDYTIACWVNFTTVGGSARQLVGRGHPDYSDQNEYVLAYSGSSQRLVFATRKGTSIVGLATATTFGAYTAGVWYLAIAEHDAANSKVRIRINNTNKDEADETDTPSTGAYPFTVGGSAAIGWGNQIMDELYIWNRLLTDSEHTELYNGGLGKTWPF